MAQLVYEFTFKGAASDTLAHAFEGGTVSSAGGVTVLRSAVVDQAALHGIIDRIYGLGLELLEIRRVAEETEQDNP
jgi:hypothetical protein